MHFVGRGTSTDEEAYTRLVGILRDGWLLSHEARQRGERTEDSTALQMNPTARLSGNERFLPEMICFADIPEHALGVHVGKYKRFGLALSKAFLAPKGARPVLYVPNKAKTQPLAKYDDIQEDWDELADVFPIEVDPRFGGTTRSGEHGTPDLGEAPAQRIADWVGHDLLSYVKFYDSSLPDDHPNNYYMEREWRSVRSVQFTSIDVTRVYVAAGYDSRLEADVPDVAGKTFGLP